jgi:hypothetical protein
MLTVRDIQAAESSENLIALLFRETSRLIPEDVAADTARLEAAVDRLPLGLQILQGIHDLATSMSFDDLAWHFTNFSGDLEIQRTLMALQAVEARRVAEIFASALEIWRPHLHLYRSGGVPAKDRHAFLNRTGIQQAIDPLNEELWAIIAELPDGLYTYCASYARRFPDRCVLSSPHS